MQNEPDFFEQRFECEGTNVQMSECTCSTLGEHPVPGPQGRNVLGPSWEVARREFEGLESISFA